MKKSRHLVTKGKRKAKAKRKSVQVQDRYEAAYQSYSDRSWIPASVQDARFDADSSTRLELVRRSRYWERNNAIVNRLCDVFEQYTVGCGLAVVPCCEDTDFNDSASQWWAQWSKFSDVNSSHPFGVLQGIMARSWFVDGECFIYKTFSKESGRPRVQLIEGHRIGTPPHLKSEEGKSIVDGIQFEMDARGHPTGRPSKYWIRTDEMTFQSGQYGVRSGSGTWDWIEGTRMLHLFEPARPGMFRGLPMLYPVMNDLHDLDDLQLLEMRAAKDAAEISTVVTNRTGSADTTSSRRTRWQIQTEDANGNQVTKNAPLFYEMTVGGRRVYISNGEKVDQFMTNRPSVATKDYWDYLVRKICAGIGISSLLVFPFSLQGTVTRADLDVASAFFRSRSESIAAILREVYLWVMSWAIKYDRQLDGAPEQWWDVSIRPPRSITVDVGRNSNAIIEELEAGIRTFQDVCGEMGHDWRQVLRQKATEAQYINKLVDEFGITREQLSQLAKQSMNINQTYDEAAGEEAATRLPETAETAPNAAGWSVVRDDNGSIVRYEPITR